MPLVSARFRGTPILERIHDGDSTVFLRVGDQGEHVRAVQFALIDLGFTIPDGATGNFLEQTSAAVVQFKTEHSLSPADAVVGRGTIGALDAAWAEPFADRDEWLSAQVHPIPEFNFTRQDELDRLRVGRPLTFGPLSAWLPTPFQAALITGLEGLLDPTGSPLGPLTPSATWGVNLLDAYHCHVVIDYAWSLTPSWGPMKGDGRALGLRIEAMQRQADDEVAAGAPSWTAVYQDLLFAPVEAGGETVNDKAATILTELHANSLAEQQPLKLLWHTFESDFRRPIEVGSDDLRRGWWNDVAPTPTALAQAPFPLSVFGQHVFDFLNLSFVIDRAGVITVMAETLLEVIAAVNLDRRPVDAAIAGKPFP